MNRRKKIEREDGTRWAYGYNSKGEVTSGLREKTASPNTSVPGWQHGYTFDEIGNRLTATTNARVSTYVPNPLNQYDSRTVPRAFDVIGKANTAASVTVDGNPATRLDEFFYQELAVGSGAIHTPYVVQATDANGTTTRSGGKFLPATPEAFTFDFDGNLTSDGRFTSTWDAENRLVLMETHASVPLAARRKLAFSYDSMGRRIRKSVWHGVSGGGWQLRHHFDFIHELNGWNILAELSGGTANSFLRTYAWGTDLSGTLSGAGGVGGLLFATLHTSGKTFAYGSDLNGNITLLVDTATGQSAATYDYGPFGEQIRQSGEYATLNPYRFSTKYTDDETGWFDYGMRYYIPVAGRWSSRDPIEERGGVNLYGFAGNSSVNAIDVLGQDFIAVGSNPALHTSVFDVPGFGHFSISYWKETKLCIKEGSTKNGTASSNPTNWMYDDSRVRGGQARVPNDASISNVIQLDFKEDFATTYSPNGISARIQERVDVSRIVRSSNGNADNYKVIYAETKTIQDASEKWEAIRSAAASYAYAEPEPFAIGQPARNWPNSHYGHLAADNNYNNSNTFIHAMAAIIGRRVPLSGWGGRSHPGNTIPVPVTGDSRPTPVYIGK